ncbi:hypothetical protein FE633_40030 [Streptomyces montanus]|uniref:Uncharacterized protein n=1 Tax=Streptomyces montanus TaxID=2580423 RepID=A0A5R9FGC7_9ACTN|nr:hypothetical protein FE633_40030 [Streptomyces montanus]
MTCPPHSQRQQGPVNSSDSRVSICYSKVSTRFLGVVLSLHVVLAVLRGRLRRHVPGGNAPLPAAGAVVNCLGTGMPPPALLTRASRASG